MSLLTNSPFVSTGPNMLSSVVRRYFDRKIIAMYIGGKSEENIIEMEVTNSRVYSNERIPNIPVGVHRHYVLLSGGVIGELGFDYYRESPNNKIRMIYWPNKFGSREPLDGPIKIKSIAGIDVDCPWYNTPQDIARG